jgi:hypothetical protein
MNGLKGTCWLGFASACLCLWASSAPAATSLSTATYSPAKAEWSNDFVLQSFDPALGSLQSVYIAVSEGIDVSGDVYNSSPGPESFSFRSGSLLTVSLPGTLGLLQPSPLASSTAYNLPGGESASYGPKSASDTVTMTYTAPADLAWFIGPGALTLHGFTQTQQLMSGGWGNIAATVITTAGASVEVQYSYVSVPEPGTLTLLMLGGALMVLRRRR